MQEIFSNWRLKPGMKKFLLLGSLLLTVAAITAGVGIAQSGYALNWYTVDGGGGTSSGDIYTLSGTIGQPDAGILGATGFSLSGGFWAGQSLPLWENHLPLIVR